MRILTITAFITLVPFIIGCGSARPKEMPETVPCKITVLDNGKPIQGAVVTLYNKTVSGSLLIEGMTNASGVAEIKTTWGSYTTKGAPLGTSQVTVDKYVEVPPSTVTEKEMERWTSEQGAKYEREREEMIDKLRIIPKEIALISSTPLSITVESGAGAALTVDINDYKNK